MVTLMKRFLLILLALFGHMALSTPASADDVAIYGTQAITLKPNVMIIFDNSVSMGRADVPKPEYDPDFTYSGRYPKNAVYYQGYYPGNFWNRPYYYWDKVTDNVGNIRCANVKKALETKGYITASIYDNTLNCGGNSRRLRTGNFRNYEANGSGDMATRLLVAKQVVTSLLKDTPDVLFGLMVFNSNDDGGRVLEECGDTLFTGSDGTQSIDNSNLITTINGLTASTNTPLAETLAEAGLYFAGKPTYFNCTGYHSNKCAKYTSPITQSCQKNYVILITDGSPTADSANLLRRTESRYIYMNNKHIKDYGKPKKTNITDEYLDDVAAFLYNEDIHPMGDGTSFDKQSLITYTIGFKTNHTLLSETARLGGGKYYTANTSSGLKEAFEQIINSIAEESSVFVAPVVPVNRTNPTSDGGNIYLAFFKPQQTGEWLGNLKKYTLNDSGIITDAFGQAAVNADGSIKENSRSLWTKYEDDGANIIKGGIGERILSQTERTIYTYQGSSKDLTDSSNKFAKDKNITDGTNPVSNALIDKVHNGTGTWRVGAIIHSEPAIVHYDDGDDATLKTGIFLGTNDGLIRCIDDYNGKELWAFVPPGQLERLSDLYGDNHDYYVDGSPSMAFGKKIKGTKLFTPELMIIGERRGGKRYYVLDISTLNSPQWKYEISPDILSSAGGESLGQSWGTPRFATVMTSRTSKTNVVFFPGGYDNQQDRSTPASSDTVGRAIFSVKSSDGSLTGLNANHGNFSALTHSIVDINVVDHDADGIATRIYAGDMGGHVFAIADDITLAEQDDGSYLPHSKVPDGTWEYKKKLFSTGGPKLFYAPTSAKIGQIRYLFFGSGNRENPFDLTEKNCFFAVKNTWGNENMTPANLVNVTDPSGTYGEDLKSKKGWYFKLSHAGEKIVSPALVDSGIIYFTTYTPPSDSTAASDSDPCAGAGARGKGRLYAVNSKDGSAVTTWGGSTKKRSTDLPSNLPMAQPMIKDRKLRLGPLTFDLADKNRLSRYYWIQK